MSGDRQRGRGGPWQGKQAEVRLLPVAGRVPPHDLDCEAAVLSAITLQREALDRIVDLLKPEHFYSSANGKIYETALALYTKGQPVDITLIASVLRDGEQLAAVGGATYLAQLSDATPAVAHVRAHAEVVYEKWRVRSLIATCQTIAAEGYGDVGEVQAWIDKAEQGIYSIARAAKVETMLPLHVLLRQSFERASAAAANGHKVTGLLTGYEKVDARIGGLEDGDLAILAARTGMGKTAFVLNVGVNVASPRYPVDSTGAPLPVEPGDGVLVFELEMTKEVCTGRIECSEARLNYQSFKIGALLPEEWRRATEAGTFLSSIPLWIDDTPGVTLLDIKASIRRKQAEFNRPATETQPARRIRLVIIDYLQLIKAADGSGNREQEIAGISRGLKQMAKELGIVVIALSQLSRKVEERPNKRPQVSDLRESGSIEQDADVIMFIYRDAYYNPETTTMRGIAELILAKVRNGAPGKALVRFTDTCTRFDNLSPSDYPEQEDDQ